MQTVFTFLGASITFISYLIYEWSILKGYTKPHRTSRFVIFLIGTIGAISLFAQGSSVSFWLLAVVSVQSFIIFLMSIKWGMGGWAKIDLVCLAIALTGIVVWQVTNQPAIALYAAVLADLSGMIPALIKTYRLPETEYYLPYVLDSIAATFTLIAISNWVWGEFLYPGYIFIINLVMLAVIFRKNILGYIRS